MEDKQPEDYLITTRFSPNQTRSALIGGSFNRHKETLGFGTCFATPKHLRIEFYNEKNRLEYKHNISK